MSILMDMSTPVDIEALKAKSIELAKLRERHADLDKRSDDAYALGRQLEAAAQEVDYRIADLREELAALAEELGK